MAWFRREPETGPDPIDALLAKQIAAQERAGKAADDVTQTADHQAACIRATSASLRQQIEEAPDRTGHTTDVRRTVEGVLALMGGKAH